MYLSFLGRNLLGGPDIFLIPESVKTWLVLDKAGNWTEKFPASLFCTFYFLWPCTPSASLASSLHTLYWALPVSIFTKICCFEIIWDLQKSWKNNVKSSRVPFILLLLMLLSYLICQLFDMWLLPSPFFLNISCPRDLAILRIQPGHGLFSLTFKELAIY